MDDFLSSELPAVAPLAGLGVGLASQGDRLAASLLNNNGTDEFDSVLVYELDSDDVWGEQPMLVPPVSRSTTGSARIWRSTA